MENKKIKIRSAVSGRIVLLDKDLKLKRVFEKKGAIKIVDLETLEEAMYNPAVERMFTDGFLEVLDEEVKSILNLNEVVILSDEQKTRYLSVLPFNEFKAKVKELPREQIMDLVNFAIEKGLGDLNKWDYLKEGTSINIMEAIKLRKNAEEGE